MSPSEKSAYFRWSIFDVRKCNRRSICNPTEFLHFQRSRGKFKVGSRFWRPPPPNYVITTTQRALVSTSPTCIQVTPVYASIRLRPLLLWRIMRTTCVYSVYLSRQITFGANWFFPYETRLTLLYFGIRTQVYAHIILARAFTYKMRCTRRKINKNSSDKYGYPFLSRADGPRTAGASHAPRTRT